MPKVYAIFFDRLLTGYSLSVHILLASVGIALPVIMLIAEYLGYRKNDKQYQVLAKRLSIIFIILFALGTASGTLIALELLIIWPKFMSLVSQVAILPVVVEVFAFFLETIFIGIYIYSWDKFKSKLTHVLLGIPVALGAVLSAVFITMLNAFMNTPTGFNIAAYLANGTVTNVQPFAVFSTPSTFLEVSHVVATSYLAGTFIIIAYGAFMLMGAKNDIKKSYYKKLIKIGIVVGIIALLFSLITGLLSISALQNWQPEKFAAIEGNMQTQAYAPERLGGIPINGTLRYYVVIPNLQSILATGNASGVVPGLDSYPTNTWPPLIVHFMFDLLLFGAIMVTFLVGIFVLLALLNKKPFENMFALKLLVASGIFAVFTLEDGWVMEELARQPWIIYNVMMVSQAGNVAQGISPVAVFILAFYIVVVPATILVIRKVFAKRPLENELIQ